VIEVDIKNIHGKHLAQLTIESAEPSTYHQRWFVERPSDYGADVRTLLEVGEMLLATHYLQAQRIARCCAPSHRSLQARRSFPLPDAAVHATPVGAMWS